MVSLDVSSVIGNGIGNSKVDQFELSTDKDEISRLEVRMHNLLFMDNLHGLKHLIITSHALAQVRKQRKNRHDLLPVVCNPDHIEGFLLLLLKKS
jgi:hypothetical protein